MAKGFTFHRRMGKQDSCHSGCCSGGSLEIQAVAACGCCSDKTEGVRVAAAEESCACCADNMKEEGRAERPVEEGCGCCSSTASPLASEVKWTTAKYELAGLDCGDCAVKLEKGIKKLKGVAEAEVIFASAKMKVTYDDSAISANDIAKAVSGFGYSASLAQATPEGSRKTVLRVSGMDCADCAAKLEKRLLALPGVQAVQLTFATGKLQIEHTTTEAAIKKAIEQAGYSAEVEGQTSQGAATPAWWANKRTQATAVSGSLLLLATVSEWLGMNESLAISLYIAAAVIGGYHTAKSAMYGLRSLTFDMNFLMTVAVIGAGLIGEWGEGATVAFLFSFGNTLQTYTMDKTRQSIRALMELAPPEALVRRNQQEQKLLVGEILVGDVMIVRPGERIAMDGIVKVGRSAVNQATITGESLPVEKNVGDRVYAGTVNEHGVLEVEVTKIAADSTLAKILHLIEEAQAQKAPSQQFVEVFSKYYTPAVLLAALGVMVFPWLLFGESFSTWFYKGLVLLVISCPCALVISTPVSIVSAIGNSSRNGILIKGGAYLEEMGAIQSIAFDKTGTLTYGRPVVTDILPGKGVTEEEFLILAASVENRSEHPLAAAIVAKAKGLPLKSVTNAQALVGRGAQADIDGKTIYIGNGQLFEELGFVLAPYEQAMTALQEQGKTVMLLGTKEGILGMIAVADTLRDTSVEAVEALYKTGIKHIAMLTGDNHRVANSIAKKVNLTAVYSDLLPEDKVKAVKDLTKEYGKVAMVGDGVNDAPALAVANVGIAMGVAGSDTALETADIALLSDDLSKLAYLIQLSRKTVAIIKQNIVFAILVKVIFIILTFAGFVNLWLAVFADTGSSILVTLNGMRLMGKLKRQENS